MKGNMAIHLKDTFLHSINFPSLYFQSKQNVTKSVKQIFL